VSGLGRYLEFSVRTPDILESLGYYRNLGFRELEIIDVWPHKYAVVSDGVLCLGLHDSEFDSPAITFVQSDLARCARRMASHGFEFTTMRLDEDVFNQLGLRDRDEHAISMLEARTFTGGDEFDDDSWLGTWFELTLPVRDTVRAAVFWGSVAESVLRMREEPTTHMRLDVGGLPLGLSESMALRGPSLCFKCPDRDALFAELERYDIPATKFPGFEGAFVALDAPEGTTLYCFDEDFLGEPYEVEESDDALEFQALAGSAPPP
jgi:hypothetical protein